MKRYFNQLTFCVLFCQLLFTPIGMSADDVQTTSATKVPKYKKNIIEERLSSIQQSVELKFNREVKKYIDGYVKRRRIGTEKILGLSTLYFPVFEYYLKLYNLPEDLKYLPVIESALMTKAVSPKGAGGLWQFIPSTAKSYGLRMNNYVDERFDIHKSSEAAARLLSDLYMRYEDWSLVIAAYNSGTVNIDNAIRIGSSKDFWEIRKHLPKETQDYVPRFIAASYVMNYYLFYNLRPEYQDYSLQLTKTTKIYSRLSFANISKDSGVPEEVILILNPSYRRKVIPPSSEGYNLVLPQIGLKESFDLEQMGLTSVGY
jgi:membrane-bound lytic murein transglycosylase D